VADLPERAVLDEVQRVSALFTSLKAAVDGRPGDDFRGLRKLKDAVQKNFAAGVVLYDGEAVAGFGDRLYAVPISQLWEGD
jgi:hypothetical protein